jgi:TRAP-type transport system periplasmic protein
MVPGKSTSHPRKSRRGFLAGAGAVGIVSTARTASSADEPYTLRLSLPLGPASVMYNVLTRWVANIANRSHGRLKIEIYPNSELAKEQASIQGLKTGTVDLTIQSATIVSALVPRVRVLDLPFLFRNVNAVYRVVDSSIGNELFAEMLSQGIVGLLWTPTGFRQVETVSKTISKPDDMKGLRIRIQPGPLYVAVMQALGAIPVTIDFSEAYVALTQRTVDGLDTTLDAIVDGKFYEVVKHVAMTNHIFTNATLLASKQKLDSLPRELQNLIKDEARALLLYWRSQYDRKVVENIDILKNKGAAFSDIDYPSFRKAMEPVYTSYEAQLGKDWIDRVSRIANTA